MKPARAIYECRRPGCTFTIIDPTDDVFGFDEEIAEHEDGHLRADAGLAPLVTVPPALAPRRKTSEIRGNGLAMVIFDETADADRPRPPRYRVFRDPDHAEWRIEDRRTGKVHGEGSGYSHRTALFAVAVYRAIDAHAGDDLVRWREAMSASYAVDLARLYPAAAAAGAIAIGPLLAVGR